MVGVLPKTVALTLVLTVAAFGLLPGSTWARDVEPSPASKAGFEWRFEGGEQDRDGDRLDDLIPLVAWSGIGALPRNADGFLPYFATEELGSARLGVLVAYERGVGESDLAALRMLGVKVAAVDEFFPAVWLESVSPQAAARVARLPGVEMVELAQKYRALNSISRQGIRVDDTSTYARGVWEDLGFKGTGIGVAVLDTGADDAHTHLDGRFIAGADTTAACGVRAVEINPDDDHALSVVAVLTYHGSHTSGTAVGDGGGSAAAPGAHSGMAPGADLYDVKVLAGAGGVSCLGSVSTGLSWVAAFNSGSTLWKTQLGVPASKKVSVVSMSLGGACSTGTDSLSQWVDWLSAQGVVSVIAVGNDGLTGCISSPSAAATAVSVGAYHSMSTVGRGDDAVASFSNCGPSVVSLNGRKPDVLASGVSVTSVAGNAAPQGMSLSTAAVKSLSGTSMATPAVAGLAALMLEAKPDLTPAQVKQILRESAEAKSSGARGAVDATYGKYHTCWGWGEADAYGAVKRADDLQSGSVSAPSTAGTGSSVTFTLAMDYTKSEFMDFGPSGTGSSGAGESVVLTLTLPSGWTGLSVASTAANIASSYTSTVSATTSSSVSGTTATVTFTFSGDPGSVTTDIDDAPATPTITVSATAPSSAGTSVATGTFSINGIGGLSDTTSVTVS